MDDIPQLHEHGSHLFCCVYCKSASHRACGWGGLISTPRAEEEYLWWTPTTGRPWTPLHHAPESEAGVGLRAKGLLAGPSQASRQRRATNCGGWSAGQALGLRVPTPLASKQAREKSIYSGSRNSSCWFLSVTGRKGYIGPCPAGRQHSSADRPMG